MRVLLYFENEKLIRKSGIGRALSHQKKALELNGVEYTTKKVGKFDLAHVNTYYFNSYQLVKYCNKHKIPVIVHGHSTFEDYKNSFRFWQIFKNRVYNSIRRVYSRADLIITPTVYSKHLIENYDFVKCPVVAISNGIDLESYKCETYIDEKREEFLKQFGINKDDKIVVGIGWYFERKGMQDFIETAKSFDNNVKFIWFGQKANILATDVIKKAILNKTDNVLLPGYVERDVICQMLHQADCFFFPSYEETEGIVVLEALACKTPIVVRDIGALAYLEDKVNCYKGNNNDNFINLIKNILKEKPLDIIENGYKVAEERNLDIIGKMLKEQYELTIKNKNNSNKL